MSDWFSMAQKLVDDFTDSMVEQANVVQAQMVEEQLKVREEVAKAKKLHEGDAHLPWETSNDSLAILSQDVMERILSLSLTEQNFTVAPPKLLLMPFIFSEHIPTAMRLLSIDSNLTKMHAKLSPKMEEEVFWHHFFFRVKYIRLTTGIEEVADDFYSATMKALKEDEVIYKPTFVPIPVVKSDPQKSPSVQTPSKPGSSSESSSDQMKGTSRETEKKMSTSEVNDDPAEKQRELNMESRRIAEAALAAEVEAELDDDDIDLTDLGDLDLDLGDDADDFDDLGDIDNDDELEAQIALELANESEAENKSSENV